MASRSVTALGELNHIINATFSNIEHIPPEGGEISEKLKAMVECYLARQVANAPVAEVDGYATVH